MNVDRQILALIERLKQKPVDYRHSLAVLDPEYAEWRPGGKPAYRLELVGHLPLLTIECERTCRVLGEISGPADEIVDFCSANNLNELQVLGHGNFQRLRSVLHEGQWRLSRNYGLTGDSSNAKPTDSVRLLNVPDAELLESACKGSAIGQSQSTLRDFRLMCEGYPVICYGAFLDGKLAGFASANPIYCGVTEISWLVVNQQYRRRGLASSLLTALSNDVSASGNLIAYHAGSAGEDLDAMLVSLGFRECQPSYRFIPEKAADQWRISWGRLV